MRSSPVFPLFVSLLLFALGACKQIKTVSDPLSLDNVDELVAGCVVCHGVQEAQRGPILNGMDSWYLRDQMDKFRTGIRGANPDNRSEHLMGVGIRNIKTDLEVAYLANWFASQPSQPAIRTIKGDLQRGEELYQSRCASCHGNEGQGESQLISPSLTHLEGWYFYQQMRKFREGHRGYDPRDEGGRVMAASVQNLSDSDLRDIIAYCIESFGLEEIEKSNRTISSERSPKPF